MNGNKLLTGFLVLGMGLSLVACSSDKPEPKKEEAKVAEKKKEKKKEEKQIDTQDRTAKLSVPEDLSPYFTSSREGVGKMESMLKDNGSIVYKCLNEENKYELNAEIKLLSSSSAEKSADLQNSMYGENDEDKKYKPCTFEGFDAYSHTINLGTVENTRLHYYVDYPVEDINKVVSIEINQKNDKEKDTSDLEPFAKAIIKNMKLEKVKEEKKEEKKEESTDAVLVREITSKTYTVTIPELTSFYTPSRDGLEVKTEVNEQQISYTLEDEFGDFKMAIYVNPISAESAEAYANRINEGFKDDESKQYKPSTVGDFSGFRKVTTSENPSFKCKDNLLLDFESVDGSAVVMSVTVEQFNDTDTADMEVAMKAILGNMKVEVK